MRHCLRLLILLAPLSAAIAQFPFAVGVIGGASLTADFENQSIGYSNGNALLAYSTPKHWIAGGTVQARLPFHLSLEADALYHELEFTQALYEKSNGTLNSVSPAPVVAWEFRLLSEYRFILPRVRRLSAQDRIPKCGQFEWHATF